MGNLNEYFSESPNLGAGTLSSDAKYVEEVNVNAVNGFLTAGGDVTVSLDTDEASEVE